MIFLIINLGKEFKKNFKIKKYFILLYIFILYIYYINNIKILYIENRIFFNFKYAIIIMRNIFYIYFIFLSIIKLRH